MAGTDQLEQLREEALAALAELADAQALEVWRVKYLGMKGAVKSALKQLKDLPGDQKPAFGMLANRVKQDLAAAFEARKGTGTSSPAPSRRSPRYSPEWASPWLTGLRSRTSGTSSRR